jgi:hypothetical protein
LNMGIWGVMCIKLGIWYCQTTSRLATEEREKGR